jgi:hypothetical protein
MTRVGIYGLRLFKQNDKYSISEIGILQTKLIYYYKLIQLEVIWDSSRVSQPLGFLESIPSQNII